MGEAVVLLAGPSTGFDVVDAADGTVPFGLTSLFELAFQGEPVEKTGLD